MTSVFKLTVAMATLLVTGPALAAPVIYGNPGTANPVTYTFTATGTGPITAYFVGATASYGSKIGLSVNGGAVDFSSFGLQNHTGSGGTANTPYGTTFDMGSVTAGDTLRFILAVDVGGFNGPATEADVDYFLNSDPTKNASGENHIYSYLYGGDADGIPAGTYIGFEDISPLAGGDVDYDDHQFVFTGVTGTPVVPLPAAAWLLLSGLGGLGFLGRRRKAA